jgi:hypothetical protein
MNERIKLLADEAGVKYSLWVGSKPSTYVTYDELEKFAALVRADEREECAKVADRQNGDDEEDSESCVWSRAARHIAAAIRARGSK